jgi:hypothetical protein
LFPAAPQPELRECPLKQGHRLVGVFGQMSDVEEVPDDPLHLI